MWGGEEKRRGGEVGGGDGEVERRTVEEMLAWKVGGFTGTCEGGYLVHTVRQVNQQLPTVAGWRR